MDHRSEAKHKTIQLSEKKNALIPWNSSTDYLSIHQKQVPK